MANANINPIQLTNTFDEWRVATNNLVQDRNILRNAAYVKDESDFRVANGALTISRSTGGTLLTVTGTGGALIGGTTTTTDLIVGDDASVANVLTVTGNTVIGGTLNVNARILAHNANGDLVLVTGNVFVNANSTLNSNVYVSKNTVIDQNLTVRGTITVGNVGNTFFTVTPNTGNTFILGDLLISGGDIIANTSNLNVFNTMVETLYVANFANSITIGNLTSTLFLRGDLNVQGGDIISTANANVTNTSANTINFGGASELIRIGSPSGVTQILNRANVLGAANLFSGANIAGNLFVSDPATFQSNSSFNANLNVSNTATISNAIITTLSITNPVTSLNVSNAAIIGNAFITNLTTTNPIQSLSTYTISVGGSVTMNSGDVRVVTSSNQTITLPASPASGQFVKISVGNFINTTIARNGQNIMGLAEDMIVDEPYSGFTLIYSGVTNGWRVFA